MYVEKVNINEKVEFVPIEVVAEIDKEGKINPVSFKVEGSSGRLYHFDIDRVVRMDATSFVGVARRIFTCKVRTGSQEKEVQLRYTLETARWELIKDKKAVVR